MANVNKTTANAKTTKTTTRRRGRPSSQKPVVVEVGISLDQEWLGELKEAGVIRDDLLRLMEGFSGPWAMEYKKVEDRLHRGTDKTYTGLDIWTTTPSARRMKIFESMFFNFVVMTKEEWESLEKIEGVSDQLVFWDEVSFPTRVKDITDENGGLSLLKEYTCLGGLISKSKLGIKGVKYTIPFQGLQEGPLFLRVHNQVYKEERKRLTEEEIRGLAGREFTSEVGTFIKAPKSILIKEGYGIDPYKSRITPVLLKA